MPTAFLEFGAGSKSARWETNKDVQFVQSFVDDYVTATQGPTDGTYDDKLQHVVDTLRSNMAQMVTGFRKQKASAEAFDAVEVVTLDDSEE